LSNGKLKKALLKTTLRQPTTKIWSMQELITNFEAQQEYALQNDLIDIDFVQIPHTVIPDSIVKVTSNDIASYVKKNKNAYTRKASRDLKYVQFSEVPTPEDKVLIENELRSLLSSRTLYNEVSKQEEIFPSFAEIDQESIGSFVTEYSDIPYANTYVSVSELTGSYANTLFNLKRGEVFGPYEDNGYSNLTRMMERKKGGRAKARHILISYMGASNADPTVTRSKAAAKKEAYALLRKVRRGANFAQLARENSDGPSANNGGDLPEFTREDMVAPFSDYVFSNRVGAKGLVETSFGFHVVEIQAKKDVVKLATIAKKLVPSDKTSNNVFATATQFELDAQGQDIEKVAESKNYAVKTVNDVKILDESLPILGNQRQLVRWAFEEERQVEDIRRFTLNTGGYVIVQVSSIKAAGLPSSAEIAAAVTPLVTIEKKKEMLLKQINSYTTLAEVASQFEQTVSSVKAVNRFTSMLTGVAKEPEVVGAAYGLGLDELSSPISGNTGIFVVQLKAKTPAGELTSYAGYKSSILNNAKQRIQATTAEAVKNSFEIEDNRSLYY
jgi:peptidyl-prolyl cis-trans isomerase D